MIEKISSKNSEYLLQSVNSSYKYYIFCSCWLPLQCFQFLLHSQLWEEYWWPIPRYKPSFINSKMEQSMAFPWTAFLSIPLPPTASSKGCNVYVTVCECVSTFKGCPCVCAPFLVFAGTTSTDTKQCQFWQNVWSFWGLLPAVSECQNCLGETTEWQHWEILKMKMKYWVFCTSLNAFHNTCMMERWNPAPLKKEHGVGDANRRNIWVPLNCRQW